MRELRKAELFLSLAKGVGIAYVVTFVIAAPLFIKLSGDALMGYPLLVLIIFVVSLPFCLCAVLITMIFASFAVRHYITFSAGVIACVMTAFTNFLLRDRRDMDVFEFLMLKHNIQNIFVASSLTIVATVSTFVLYRKRQNSYLNRSR